MGLTGHFGAGKSTVARLFKEMGSEVLDADRLTHEVYRKKSWLYKKLHSLFPELKGPLDRKKISRIVFRDRKRRRSLEQAIHPYVFNRIREEVGKKPRSVFILEVPLLFESGFYHETNCNVLVKARTQVVLERLARKGFKAQDAKERWRAQMPLARKIRLTDFIIDNSNGLKRTRKQVVRVWKQIERSLTKHGKTR